MNLKGKNWNMYEEAQALLRTLPHPTDILEGRIAVEESCVTLTSEQKAILLPLLARDVGQKLKNLEKDEKIPASVGEGLFGFLNHHCTWQERVGFTHMVSLLQECSFSLFERSNAMGKFAKDTRAYIQGSI